ncbi:hypothetical protein QQS21_003389 [Conoideocrella luteorostrata]|uniref:Thioredoxin domain-containing protein n=1 Tax=Conoideocrella luteorostrata TaxID=1105319 RepID=A0AAJ0CUC0_9HYPO|nr:hypothetical protein QQS21_003389 [Conoideocrella luteorostrata]
MSSIYIYVLIILAVLFFGPALFSKASPIPEISENVYKIQYDTELDALFSTTKHVVVDFYADWCPPCRAIAPIFSKLADSHSKRTQLAFAKVNVDHVKNIAQRYNVSAMPTFMFFENGVPTAVEVEGMQGRQSVTLTDAGHVSMVRGADRAALEAVVQVLAGKGKGISGKGLDNSRKEK